MVQVTDEQGSIDEAGLLEWDGWGAAEGELLRTPMLFRV